jgi:hypothetical protein
LRLYFPLEAWPQSFRTVDSEVEREGPVWQSLPFRSRGTIV